MAKLFNNMMTFLGRSTDEEENALRGQGQASPNDQESKISDFEDDLTPDMIGESLILTPEDVRRLNALLPPRLVGVAWRLMFSTESDGFSLQRLYMKLGGGAYDIPAPARHTLLVIEDTRSHRFGALVPDTFRVQQIDAFYGTGETFLFRLGKDQFAYWPFTHLNDFVLNCRNDSITIGASEGRFGIHIDENLNVGRTEAVDTYKNEPLVHTKDFAIRKLEVWQFQ